MFNFHLIPKEGRCSKHDSLSSSSFRKTLAHPSPTSPGLPHGHPLGWSFFLEPLLIRGSVLLSLSHEVLFQPHKDGHLQPVLWTDPSVTIFVHRGSSKPSCLPLHLLVALSQKYREHMNAFYLPWAEVYLSAQWKNKPELRGRTEVLSNKNSLAGFNTRLWRRWDGIGYV